MAARAGFPGTAAVVLALVAPSSPAHHPLDEIYRRDGAVSLTGVVAAIDWSNPHVVLMLAVQTADGAAVDWQIEMDPPHALAGRGWSQTSITTGQRITVAGFGAKDASPRAVAATITLPGGQSLVASTDESWNWRTIR